MTFAARIELDSVNPRKHRLTTVVATYPREVLAEARTHRTLAEETIFGGELCVSEVTLPSGLSKNSASSRAIPVQKMLDAVIADPYIPIHWSAAQKGMQADGQVNQEVRDACRSIWLNARDAAVRWTELLLAIGIHKQVANRLLEPWAWVTQIITGTDDNWANFFALRTHAAAHPALRRIARMIYLRYLASTPTPLDYGQWHLPFLDDAERAAAGMELGDWPLVSAGRCCRVSFLQHDGRRAVLEDIALARRLMEPEDGGQAHASPTEHQATPMCSGEEESNPQSRSNLTGWLQYRKLVPRERCTVFEPPAEEVAAWEAEEKE